MKSLVRLIDCIVLLSFSSFVVFASKCDPNGAVDNNRISCTKSGELLCMPGWRGADCNVAKCQVGCHSTHGYCTQPGECKCALGWRGKNCDECVPLPGCKRGFCNETSYECICNPGWEGTYCSSPVCGKGCHSSRGFCIFPGECRCRFGWGGETCELCRPAPDCKNGYCTKPLECLCKKGWDGENCDKPICQATCSKEHGSCTKPGQCRCQVGWWGDNCETCFPYPECKHGHCDKPWECICDTGWRGMKCDEEFNIGQSYCHTHPNPCKNGGKCLDMDEEQTYTCACNPLYTGEHCDFLRKQKPFYFPILPRSAARRQSSVPNKKVNHILLAEVIPTNITYDKPITSIKVNDAVVDITTENDQLDSSSLKEEVIESLPKIVTSVSTEISVNYLQKTQSNKQDIATSTETSRQTVTEQDLVLDISPTTENFADSKIVSIENVSSELDIDQIIDLLDSTSKEKQEKNFQIKVPIVETQPTERKNLKNYKKGRKFRTDVTIRKKVSPILFLQLRSPTKPFYNPLEDDPIKDTDANSPKANQITKRRRYVKYNSPVNSAIGKQSGPTFPFTTSIQLGPRNIFETRYTSEYPVNSIDPVILESIIQNSNIRSIIPARLTGTFKEKDIARTGGNVKGSDPLQYFSSQEDYETFQASSPSRTRGISNGRIPQAFHIQNYNGRVHIGDTKEVDEDVPIEEILQAFIELKKLLK